MGNVSKKTLRNIHRLIRDMARCDDPEILCAALAMLPEHHPDGVTIVTSAAARIIAELYSNEHEAEALEAFSNMEKQIRMSMGSQATDKETEEIEKNNA